MAQRVRMLKSSQNDFLKAFERLTRTRSSWQAWSDFVNMAACSITNAVDRGTRWQSREDRYKEIARRYDADELQTFCELLAMTVTALDEDLEQDFLGSIFQALELNSHWHGQFFTPYHVCEFMASVTNMENVKSEIERRGCISVNDPACGAGALLIAAANDFRKREIDFQQHVLFVAQDIDPTAAMMCYIQLSLLGCPGYVIVGDTLCHPPTDPLPADYEVWYTPMYFSDVWHWRRVFHSVDKAIAETRERGEAERQADRPLEITVSNRPTSGFWFLFDLQSTARKDGF